MLLIIFGDGVVANVVLKQTKGHNYELDCDCHGLGLGGALAVYAVGEVSTDT